MSKITSPKPIVPRCWVLRVGRCGKRWGMSNPQDPSSRSLLVVPARPVKLESAGATSCGRAVVAEWQLSPIGQLGVVTCLLATYRNRNSQFRPIEFHEARFFL